ncbi:unnamed protein product [Brachionus calyciflorus]|uniref:ASX DEUBAD domain-containing protein n=1 Tax=Brachionus calyciflorus TaxID=104777 RepID=A0A813M033_9BILA|nr:unnamed protein product [Brachionus calyciflorus]
MILNEHKHIESPSSTTSLSSTTTVLNNINLDIDSTDNKYIYSSDNSSSDLVQTRHKAKTKLHDNSNTSKTTNFTTPISTQNQPKKTIYSYLVERQQQKLFSQPEQQIPSRIIAEEIKTSIDQIDNKKISKNKRTRQAKKDDNYPSKKRKRTQKNLNQPTESSIASSSSSSSSSAQISQTTTTTTTRSNTSNISQYLSDLYESENKDKLDQIFSLNSLFNSSQSLLTKLDLKVLFQPAIFESLPRQSQLKLIKLLPECDRLFDSHGSFKLSIGALNNEFIKKCCTEWQQKLANGNFDNLENSLHNTTITRSTRLKQQRLLESLQANENESSDDETEEFFYYDEDDFLDASSSSNLNQPNETINQNDKSIYESAESTTNSLNSSFDNNNNKEEEEGDNQSSNESFDNIPSPSSEQESFDEDLELKRKELEREAKRLLRKKEKLSSKFYQINADCMISTSDTASITTTLSEPVRKSQRKRTLSKKFTDDEYSFNNDDQVDLDEKNLKLEVSLNEDQKGELKLKIKRVQNQSNLNKLNSLIDTDDFPTKRKRNNSSNFKSSLNNSPLNIFPELTMPICSPAVSPSEKIVIKSNSSPTVHLQAPLPPIPQAIPPQNIFNDEEDEEIPRKEFSLPDNIKTLASIKTQIAEKKRKLSKEYNSNIQKIVTELKSIGSNQSNESETTTSNSLSPQNNYNKIQIDEFLNLNSTLDSEDNQKMETREDLPSFLVNLDLINLLKIQQEKEKKLINLTHKNVNYIDLSILNENLENEQNCEVTTLPNINSLIMKVNPNVSKPVVVKEQFLSPLPVNQFAQAPNRVVQSPIYQNGYQTPTRQNFITSSPNYQTKQSPTNFQNYQRYPPQSPQFIQQPNIPQQMPQQIQQIIPQQVQTQIQQQIPQQITQQIQPQITQQIPQQIPQQIQQYNQQYQNYPHQYSQPQQTGQVFNQQNVVLVQQSPIKYQQPQQQVYNTSQNIQQNQQQQQQQQIMKPQIQMNQINIQTSQQLQQQQQQQQSINVSIPQPQIQQNLANSIISPINSQNSQSSPIVPQQQQQQQSAVTPTKAKRKEKEKPPNLNLNTNTPSTTPSQINSNSVNNQSQNSQNSRSARSTQHQLTVAQLLSQKHQQQQQKAQEITRNLTSPLTIPTVLQVNEQVTQSPIPSTTASQIIIPASLTSNSQPNNNNNNNNNSQVIKIVAENTEIKNVQSYQAPVQKFQNVLQQQNPTTNPALSIPTSLSQSAKIILSNNEPTNSSPNHHQPVTCFPLNSLNFNQTTPVFDSNNKTMKESLINDNKKEIEHDVLSQTQVLNNHECSYKKPMIECEKCFLFLHDDCIYLKNVDNRSEPIKLCVNCINNDNMEKKMENL